MTRQAADGTVWVRTSISMDPRVIAVFKARNIQVSAWVDRMAKLTFGLTTVDDEIENVREIAAVIESMQEEDRLRAENTQMQEASAITAMRSIHKAEQHAVQAAHESEAAERERLESHSRKLRDSWLVAVKKKRIIPGGLLRKLPENDINCDHIDFWPTLARDLSNLAGEQYSIEEVVAYAKQQCAVV